MGVEVMTLSREERAIIAQGRDLKARERKAKKAERPKSPKADRGRVRDAGFLAYLRRLPCVVGPIGCSGPVEAAHVRLSVPGRPNPGLQVKPSDRFAVSLCAGHHRTNNDAQHTMSERRFWDTHGMDPFAVAERLYAAYQTEGAKP